MDKATPPCPPHPLLPRLLCVLSDRPRSKPGWTRTPYSLKILAPRDGQRETSSHGGRQQAPACRIPHDRSHARKRHDRLVGRNTDRRRRACASLLTRRSQPFLVGYVIGSSRSRFPTRKPAAPTRVPPTTSAIHHLGRSQSKSRPRCEHGIGRRVDRGRADDRRGNMRKF